MSNIVEEHSDQCSLEGWHSNIRFCAAFVIDKTINELVCGHVESMYVITSSFDESLLEGGVIILSKNSVHDVVEGSLGCRSSPPHDIGIWLNPPPSHDNGILSPTPSGQPTCDSYHPLQTDFTLGHVETGH